MSDLLESSNVTEAFHLVRSERRRPGRIVDISPNLIPLLYGSTEPPLDQPSLDHEKRRDSDLAPALGIAISVLISGLIWAMLLWII